MNIVSHAWPGGYPCYYLTNENDVLCSDCALIEIPAVEASGIHWEGEPINCDECNTQIESAYGEVTE